MKKKTYEELVKESPVTYEMYANMEDDGNRYEISDGVLELLSPTPSTIHQMIRTELQFSLYRSCQDDFIIIQAPLDFILSDTEVRQPDLLMIHHSRNPLSANGEFSVRPISSWRLRLNIRSNGIK